MTFLPVAERELRVAARKSGTFWLRISAALTATLLLVGFFALARLLPLGFGFTGSLGPSLFSVLTWLGLGAASSAGLFFTSDSLSQEKREGTIGFLFLTDLRGYDVVFGKLLSTSLRGFYAMLAVLPILGMALLLGGVTGQEFWESSLALANALFVSLTVGLFISALTRHSNSALIGTLLLLVLWIGLGPFADAFTAAVHQRPFNPRFSFCSPGYLMVLARQRNVSAFFLGLLLNQALAWTLLGCACFIIPRVWQERARSKSLEAQGWRYAWRFGSARQRQRKRERLLGLDPIGWLVAREHWQAALVWASAILLSGLSLLLISERQAAWALFWSSCSSLIILLFYLGTAAFAVRFAVEARQTGVLELILVTPLSAQQIVQGQWRAFRRVFGLPLALCLAAELIGSFAAQKVQWGGMGPVAFPPSGGTTNSGTSVTMTIPAPMTTTNAAGRTVRTFLAPQPSVIAFASLAATLTLAGNFVALIWFGMWMGLTSKSINLATLKTLLFVQIIPWFVLAFTSGIVASVIMFSFVMKKAWANGATSFPVLNWFPLLSAGLAAVLALGKDLAFCLWARRKLYREFRERAIQQLLPTHNVVPPRLPPIAPPPVPS